MYIYSATWGYLPVLRKPAPGGLLMLCRSTTNYFMAQTDSNKYFGIEFFYGKKQSPEKEYQDVSMSAWAII